MTWPRPGRTELLITALAVLWAGALLVPDRTALAVTAVLYGSTLPFFRVVPPLAVAGLLTGELALWALGVSGEQPVSLPTFLVSLFGLGRWARPWWLVLPGAGLPAVAFVRDDFNVASLVFVAVLVCATWTVGRLVTRRDASAAAAHRDAAELARTDPADRARRLVAKERARLAGDALGVVRSAVDGMLRNVDRAARDADPGACVAVQNAGRRAVGELRRLLGLLRAEEDAAVPGPPHNDGPPPPRIRRWDLALTALAIGIVAFEYATVGADRPRATFVLTAAACIGLAVLRLDAALACAVSAAPVLVALLVDQPLFHGIELVLVAVLLAWTAAADGRPRAVVAFGGWALLSLVEIRLHEPGNEAILVAFVLVGAVPGYLWRRRGIDETSARARADRLRAVQSDVAERAVRAERLRVARELHDVTSSAIGVMVLQAGAAEVHFRRGDGTAARAALDAVRTAGFQAQAELAVLFGLLDAGAVGAAGLAGPAPVDDLPAAVGALVERMRSGGMAVGLEIDAGLGAVAPVAGTVYRVVQESLTNAAKHAPGSRVLVRLARAGDDLCVEVTDDGPVTEPSDGGFGLVGLAERVRSDGGQVTAGPGRDGGFTVTARLPVAAGHRTGAAP